LHVSELRAFRLASPDAVAPFERVVLFFQAAVNFLGASKSRALVAIAASARPCTISLAALYRQLGIDAGVTLPDHNGRPQYVLENREVVEGLI
jgi:hypothetical protein